MSTLFIVDPQYDFIEGGKLAIEGGQEALRNICRYIKLNKALIDEVVITVDWHPHNHCSFKEWPVHCVQHTKGAAIYEPLLNVLIYYNVPFRIVEKGTLKNEEAYCAFTYFGIEDVMGQKFHTLSTEGDYDILLNTDKEFVFCGLAGDICVLDTMKELLDLKPILLANGVACIDKYKLSKFITDNNIKLK